MGTVEAGPEGLSVTNGGDDINVHVSSKFLRTS